jgi:hypothetical protein
VPDYLPRHDRWVDAGWAPLIGWGGPLTCMPLLSNGKAMTVGWYSCVGAMAVFAIAACDSPNATRQSRPGLYEVPTSAGRPRTQSLPVAPADTFTRDMMNLLVTSAPGSEDEAQAVRNLVDRQEALRAAGRAREYGEGVRIGLPDSVIRTFDPRAMSQKSKLLADAMRMRRRERVGSAVSLDAPVGHDTVPHRSVERRPR